MGFSLATESEIYCVRQGPTGRNPGRLLKFMRWVRSGDSQDHTLLMAQEDIEVAVMEVRRPAFAAVRRGVLFGCPCRICGAPLSFRRL